MAENWGCPCGDWAEAAPFAPSAQRGELSGCGARELERLVGGGSLQTIRCIGVVYRSAGSGRDAFRGRRERERWVRDRAATAWAMEVLEEGSDPVCLA